MPSRDWVRRLKAGVLCGVRGCDLDHNDSSPWCDTHQAEVMRQLAELGWPYRSRIRGGYGKVIVEALPD